MVSEGPMFPFDIPRELYQWFLLTYGTTAIGRMAVEAYKQIAVLEAAWYDVPTAMFSVLGQGFLQHALLSLALAEGMNMVLGALIKRKARTEGRAEGHAQGRAQGRAEGRAETNKEWRAWLRRKEEAEARGDTFSERPPED